MRPDLSDSKTYLIDKYVPDAEFLYGKAAEKDAVILYQPYLKERERREIHPDAIALDITFNAGADAREYELFSALHTYHDDIDLDENVFWGLLSRKFEHKSSIGFSDFLSAAKNARSQGYDCYLFNPMIANNAVFTNVWEHGIMCHGPGMDAIYKHINSNITNISGIQGVGEFFFCNYVCGNRKFWSGYFRYCQKILDDLEKEARLQTDVGDAFSGSGNYPRDKNLSMRAFIIERLLGNYISHARKEGLKAAYYTPELADFEWKFCHRAARILKDIQALKEVSIQLGDRGGIMLWEEKRRGALADVWTIIRQDDPSDWLMMEK